MSRDVIECWRVFFGFTDNHLMHTRREEGTGMNLLIVDDEPNSVQAVSDMLDWPAIGISRVFTARSAREARARIQSSPVDILLCDIEMPQESGLDLLEWVNREGFDISCLYMTCYPEFSYAQRAVKLGSMAYLLKPVDPDELKREITGAIARRQEMNLLHSARQILEESTDKNCQQFWRDLFYGEFPSDRSSIRSQIQRLHLPLDPDWHYCPVLLSVRRWSRSGDGEAEAAAYGRYAVHNIALELFDGVMRDICSWYTVMQFGKNAQVALCGGPDAAALESGCRKFAEQYLEAERTWLQIQTVCCAGRALPAEETAGEIEALLLLDSSSLKNQDLVVHTAEPPAPQRLEPNLIELFDRWNALLEGERFRDAAAEIDSCLADFASDRTFTRRRFIYFLNSYAGLLTGYAERHHFPVSLLTSSPEDADCFERSDQSLDEMRAWVSRSLQLLEAENARSSQDPVTATRVFIEDHLADEMDVSQIAENVHLNQDYLTRIFRRETGFSVKGYVVNRRMEKARELLETSRLPITDVAFQVGYGNYTSFNRSFRKVFGVSPQSLRRSSG